MNKAFFIGLMACILALPGFAQVTVSGSVENNGKRLDKATIRIYEDGKFDRTVNANNSFPRKGNFSFTLDVNHDYLIVLYRPFMVPRKIAIATFIPEKVLAENEEGIFLDFGPIPVFENFAAANIGLFDQPTDMLRFNEQQSDFVRESRQGFSEDLIAYKAEIDRLKARGEEPLRKPAQRPSLLAAEPVKPQPSPADPAPETTPEAAPVAAEDALAEAEVNAAATRPEPAATADRTPPPAEPLLAEEAPAKGSLNRELLRVNAAEQRKRQSPGNTRLSNRYREASIDLLDRDFERKVAVEREATKRNLDGQNALADQAVKTNLVKDLLKIAAEKERHRKREAFQARVPAARYGERPVAVVVPEIHQDTISTGLQTEYITQLNYPGKRTVLRKIFHFYGSTEYYRNDQAIAEDDYLQALRIHQRL